MSKFETFLTAKLQREIERSNKAAANSNLSAFGVLTKPSKFLVLGNQFHRTEH